MSTLLSAKNAHWALWALSTLSIIEDWDANDNLDTIKSAQVVTKAAYDANCSAEGLSLQSAENLDALNTATKIPLHGHYD